MCISLDDYCSKIVTRRHTALEALISHPSAENAGDLRELNGELRGMLAAMNCLEKYCKAAGLKELKKSREIIQKTI